MNGSILIAGVAAAFCALGHFTVGRDIRYSKSDRQNVPVGNICIYCGICMDRRGLM